MAKFKVKVGGFVSTYRERTLIVHADDDESEANEKKAELKFIDWQQIKPGNMCDEGTINSIEQID